MDFIYVILLANFCPSLQLHAYNLLVRTEVTHMFDLSRSSTLWQPGERLPFNNVHVPETPSQLDGVQHREFESTSVVEVLQTLQSSLDGQLTQINSTLEQISERLDVLEERQESVENKIVHLHHHCSLHHSLVPLSLGQ